MQSQNTNCSLDAAKNTKAAYLNSICEAQNQLQRVTDAINKSSDIPELMDADVTCMISYANSLRSLANIIEDFAEKQT